MKLHARATNSPAYERAVQKRDAMMAKFKEDTNKLFESERESIKRSEENSLTVAKLKIAAAEASEKSKQDAAVESENSKLAAINELNEANQESAGRVAQLKIAAYEASERHQSFPQSMN